MKIVIQSLFFLLTIAQISFSQWRDTTNTIPGKINDIVPIRLPHTTHTPGRPPVPAKI